MYRSYLKPCMKAAFLMAIGLLGAPSIATAEPSVKMTHVQETIVLNVQEFTIEGAFNYIERNSNYVFAYDRGVRNRLGNIVNISVRGRNIEQLIGELCHAAHLQYVINGRQVLIKNAQGQQNQQKSQQHETRKITGTVRDSKGEPLTGATIMIKGTNKGAVTDIDGHFALDVPQDAVLTISYIGFNSKEIRLGSKQSLNISLSEDDNTLNELVVVGYGSVRKRDLTGSVTSIKSDDVTAIPTTNALESLQGKIAGMDMTVSSGQAGANPSFTIRGNRSLNASNAPLILVDGVPYGSDLDIDPNNIESIDVLKDASSTAIYGSRGANGVILITTKQAKEGRTQVSYNGYYSFDSAWDYPDVMNTAQYADYVRESYKSIGKWKSIEDDPYCFPAGYDYIKNDLNTDWIGLILKNGYTTSHSINLSTSNDQTSFWASIQYQKQKGEQANDNMTKYSSTIGGSHKITNTLTFNANSIFTYNENNYACDAFNMAIKYRPYGTPYDEDGNVVIYPYDDGQTISPLAETIPGNYKNNRKTYHMFVSGGLSWRPIKGLEAKTNFNVNYKGYRQGQYYGKYTTKQGGGNSYASASNVHNTNFVWDNTLNYHFDLNKINDFNVMMGSEMTKSVIETYDESGQKLLSSAMSFYNLGATQVQQQIGSNYTKSTMVSFFGRINYKLLDRYLLTATFRTDGSSVLAKGHKWGWFPSIAAAWRITEEPWMKSTKSWLNNLKLRLSYGVSGNSAVNAYQTQGGLGQTMYVFDVAGSEVAEYGYWPTSLANQDLSWEKTGTYNLGLDIGLFNSRLNISADLYDQETHDLLMEKQIPVVTGFKSSWANIGKTRNRGIEIVVNSHNIITKNFSWCTDLTFTKNKEEIRELADGQQRDIANSWFVGQPTSVFYTLKKLGIWQTDEADKAATYGYKPGEVKNLDINNDGKITMDDRIIVGTPRPKFIVGMKNAFTYRDFDFSCFIFWRHGSTLHMSSTFDIQAINRGYAYQMDYWTPNNPTNNYPRPNRSFSSSDISLTSLDYYNGSFLKVRDITLGYNVPKATLRPLKINKIHLYCTLKNFFEITRAGIHGYDSERNGAYGFPTIKQVVLGLNIDF